MNGEWPLVGRSRELDQLVGHLGNSSPGAVVLAGGAGVGKSRLAREALAIAERRGAHGRQVLATKAGAAISLAALAPLLPSGQRRLDTRWDHLRWAADVIAGDPARRTVLLVDDAHHLDDASATVVLQLAQEHRLDLLVTVRSGQPVPDPVSALWKESVGVRLDIGPLPRHDVEALLEEALGGPVDGMVKSDLWRASRGNVFFRQLVVGALDAGILVEEHGIWRLTRALSATPRLAELIGARVGDLTDEERDGLELVAVAEQLPLEIVATLVRPAVLAVLDRRALLTVTQAEQGSLIGLAHPLHGEVVRAGMTPLRRMVVHRGLGGGGDDGTD